MPTKKRSRNGLKRNLTYDKHGFIVYRKMYQGNQITFRTGTKIVKDANAMWPQLNFMAMSNLYGYVKPKQLENISLIRLIDEYLEADHPNWNSKRTIQTYKSRLRRYEKMGYTGGPENRKAIRRELNACIRWGLAKGYDVEKYRLEGKTKSGCRTRIATKSELEKIFLMNDKLGCLLKFIYYTGIRIGEAATVRKENYDDGWIPVWGKTGKRMVKVNKQALAYLDDYYIWHGKDGKKIKESNIEYHLDKVWLKKRKEIAMGELWFHDLRRTFGTHFLLKGGSMHELSLLLGHSSYQVTAEHYAFVELLQVKDFEL